MYVYSFPTYDKLTNLEGFVKSVEYQSGGTKNIFLDGTEIRLNVGSSEKTIKTKSFKGFAELNVGDTLLVKGHFDPLGRDVFYGSEVKDKNRTYLSHEASVKAQRFRLYATMVLALFVIFVAPRIVKPKQDNSL